MAARTPKRRAKSGDVAKSVASRGTTTRKRTPRADSVAGAASSRRSPCPVACTLDLIGDRWTMLVIRDLFLGRTRFRDFLSSPEGIPTNILTERLERLQTAGLAERVLADDGSGRPAYRLTDKGHSLAPVLRGLRDWGLQWIAGTRAELSERTR